MCVCVSVCIRIRVNDVPLAKHRFQLWVRLVVVLWWYYPKGISNDVCIVHIAVHRCCCERHVCILWKRNKIDLKCILVFSLKIDFTERNVWIIVSVFTPKMWFIRPKTVLFCAIPVGCNTDLCITWKNLLWIRTAVSSVWNYLLYDFRFRHRHCFCRWFLVARAH